MKKTVFFVTGTNTGVGKTFVSCQILRTALQDGKKTLGLKPVASGAEMTSQGLRNDDAMALQAVSSVKLPYESINPFCFSPSVAPHLAAAQQGVLLRAAMIAHQLKTVIAESDADVIVIEGAGGWRVPLNDSETLADVAVLLGVPVILVVGMTLGCINHALLTAEAIRADGLPLAGWIANDLGLPMPMLTENIATIEQRLGEPLIHDKFIIHS